MAFTRKDSDGIGVVEISGEGALSISEAASLHKELVNCLESCDGLTLDMTNAKECDTAGIQLLYSARKSFEKAGKSFSVENPTDEIRQSVVNAGLNPDEILTTQLE